MLNCFYLRSIKSLERILAHEYGHHWTIGHLLNSERFFEDNPEYQVPWLYYRIRQLHPGNFLGDYKKGWNSCDKEILAEDYKHLFTPYKEEHSFSTDQSVPSSEISHYISKLCRQVWH